MATPTAARRPSTAFTLIELLMVIAIITILVGLLMAALGLVRRNSHRAATMNAMQQIAEVTLIYLDTWPSLGDAGAADGMDFRKDPWAYLHRRHAGEQRLGKVPQLEFPGARLVTWTSSGECQRASGPETATHIIDYFGIKPDNVLGWHIEQVVPAGSPVGYAKRILLRSSSGTPDNNNDDLILDYSNVTGRFDSKRFNELESTLQVPFNDPAFAPLP